MPEPPTTIDGPADRWDARYRSDVSPGWDLGGPSELVQRLATTRLKPGSRVVVPGCGLGHDVEALARAGHHVTGIDIAPTALDRAGARVRAAGVAPAPAFICADVLRLDADPAAAEGLLGTFDGAVEHTCWCALDPTLVPDYLRSVRALLRPGGLYLGALLHFEGGGPPFGTHPAEARAWLELVGFDVVTLEETDHVFAPRGVPQLALVARRPGA